MSLCNDSSSVVGELLPQTQHIHPLMILTSSSTSSIPMMYYPTPLHHHPLNPLPESCNNFHHQMYSAELPAECPVLQGPMTSIYNILKTCVPNLHNIPLVSTLDKRVTSTVQGCDSIVVGAMGAMKKVSIGNSVKRVKEFVGNSSKNQLKRVEKGLDSTIRYLGGKVADNKEENKDTLARLTSILSKAIHANSLLFRAIYSKSVSTLQCPKALALRSGRFLESMYIQLAAASIAIKELVVDLSKQVWRRMGSGFTETKTKVKLLLVDLKNPEKAFEMMSQKFGDFKRVTVKLVNDTIEIVIDKKHYYDNLRKVMEIVKGTVGDIVLKVDDRYEQSVDFARDLYAKTIKNYKIQKILLNKSRFQALEQSESDTEATEARELDNRPVSQGDAAEER